MIGGMSGKSVVITGAANGIGLAICRQFAKAGANVMMADIDEDALEKEVGTIQSEGFDGEVQFFHGDMREKLAMKNLMSASVDAYDNVHVLVNAACKISAGNPIDPAQTLFEEVLHQNVIANLQMSQLAAKRMIEYADEEQESGTRSDRAIINISSILGTRCLPELLSFSVSCAAVEQLTRTLATTLAKHRIRVNAVAFGGVFGHAVGRALSEIEDLQDAIAEVTPLGQPDAYRHVGEAAVFLASPASEFTTGQVLSVDGGRSLVDPLSTAIV